MPNCGNIQSSQSACGEGCAIWICASEFSNNCRNLAKWVHLRLGCWFVSTLLHVWPTNLNDQQSCSQFVKMFWIRIFLGNAGKVSDRLEKKRAIKKRYKWLSRILYSNILYAMYIYIYVCVWCYKYILYILGTDELGLVAPDESGLAGV